MERRRGIRNSTRKLGMRKTVIIRGRRVKKALEVLGEVIQKDGTGIRNSYSTIGFTGEGGRGDTFDTTADDLEMGN